ncbi:unnamed protein product, partial [Mesorhabditis spiculigera]
MHEKLRASLMSELKLDCLVNGTFAGIEFSEANLATSRLSYKLWHPDEEGISQGEGSPWHLKSKWIGGNPYYGKEFSALPNVPPYWSYGYLSFKQALDDTFLKKATNGTAALDKVYLQRFPEPPFQERGIQQFLEFLPVIYAFLIYPTVLHLAREISAEIDAGLKDFMRVMGLSSSVFFLTHGFIAWVKAAVIFTICAYPIMTSLEFVPWHLVLVVVYLYSFAVIAFSMLCSSLLKTSNNVLKLAIVAWVVSVGATFIRRPSLDQYVHCYFYSLNLNHAFRLAIEIMAEACNREYHLGWPQIFDTPKIAFNLFGAMLMLLIDFVWMTAAALIIDDIRTNEESYFLTIFKKRQNNTTIGNGRRNPELEDQIDFVRQESGADIRVDGLRKMYHTGNWALEGMNLRANRGQITVLLGHNGAGKSTTFSIICGLIEPTLGEVHVTEKPVGLCPQKNSLFDKLTVRETIWFFHQLKGSDTDYKQETDEYLKALHFEDKADDLVQNLSGGTKRKLCVAVAICGESQAVLLDEPTAGMDPGARRDVENLLQHIKPHRTILLTTHYMDEAERLGDWIYIMQAGKDIINGSPGYLKKQYGTGFVLTLVSAAVVGGKAADTATPVTPEDVMALGDRVVTVCANVIGTSAATFARGKPRGRQIEITIPTEYKELFPEMFKWVEREINVVRPNQAVLLSFGVSLNTLEQIFLKVGELGEKDAAKQQNQQQPAIEGPNITENWTNDTLRRKSGPCLWAHQFRYLLWKRWLYSKRNISQFITQVFLPILLVLLAWAVGNRFADGPGKEFNLSKDLDLTAVSPIKCTMQADPNRTRHEIDVFHNYLKTHCAQFLWIDAKTSFDQRIFDEPKYLPALGVGVRLLADGTRAIFNAHGYHTAPAAMHLVANARLRHFTGKPSASIHSSIQVYAPLKDARQHQADAAAEDQVKNFLLIPVLILAFSLVSSTFVMFHVEERASHFKHQQLLTKLHPLLFWASSLLYDAVIFFTVCLVSIGVFYLAGWMQGALQYVFLLWALYFWACCPFIYSVSYLFESPSKASTLLILWQLITSIFALIVEAIQFAMAPESSDWTGTFLVFLLPPYAMGNGMKAIAMWKVFRELPPDFASIGSGCNRTDLWAWCMLGRPAAMMFFFGLASWVLFVCLSSRHISRGFSTLWGHIPFKNAPPRMDGERDVDVENEERYVAEPLISRPQLVVRKLKKVYGWNFSKPAVNELTFAVDKGQCFGLLGVNGAGKTTTIDIITGLRYATSGSIEILGEDGPATVPIGYCPQFDAVLLDLTGRETLELMACFHGYNEPEKIASEALSAVGMLGHGDKQLRYCSGGQRRKISSKYSSGYSVTVVLAGKNVKEAAALQGANRSEEHRKVVERVDDAMKQTFPGAVMREAGESLTVSWQIPATTTTSWSSLWQKMVSLAPRGNNLEIVDYSITQCSLEDTFLNLLGNEQRADLEMDSRTRATPPTQAASSNA